MKTSVISWSAALTILYCMLAGGVAIAQIGGPGGPPSGPGGPPNEEAGFSVIAEDANKAEGDTGTTPFTFTVTRDWLTNERATVSYAINEITPSECAGPDFLLGSPAVIGRNFYYHDSGFADGIPPNKTALLKGQKATFSNYTSYSKGINGVIVDVAPGTYPNGFSVVEDSEFKIGNSNDTSTWAAVVDPTCEFILGGGVAGSDRLVFTWPNNTIEKTWLEVTLFAKNNNLIVENDVSYYGNVIGETGNEPSDAIVNPIDIALTRQNQTGLGSADIANDYDHNRDGLVNLADVAIARENQSGFFVFNLIAPGNIVFEAGKTSKTLTLHVIGDTIPELDDRFEVVLVSAISESGQEITISDAFAEGTILNDDGSTADVIFVVDRTQSMKFAHQWLASETFNSLPLEQSVLAMIADKLTERGLCENRFGLISFSDSNIVAHQLNPDLSLSDEERLWVDRTMIHTDDPLAPSMEDAILGLGEEGGTEFGFAAIEQALCIRDAVAPNYVFRDPAVINIVLLTDEDADDSNHNRVGKANRQQDIINKLTNVFNSTSPPNPKDVPRKFLFHVITSIAVTGNTGDIESGGATDNTNMFTFSSPNEWDTDLSGQYLTSFPIAGTYSPNSFAVVELYNQYRNSRTMPMCKIESLESLASNVPASWSIESRFRIEAGGAQENARFYFSDSDNLTFTTTDESGAFLEVDANTDEWKVHSGVGMEYDFFDDDDDDPNTPPVPIVWADLELDVDYDVEIRYVDQRISARMDLFVDGAYIGSIFDAHSKLLPTRQLKWIGVGCDQSNTSFDGVQLNSRIGISEHLPPDSSTPFNYVNYLPFKRIYLNSFGSENGTSFGENVIGIDLANPDESAAGSVERGFFYDSGSSFPDIPVELTNPDYSQAKENIEADYLRIAKAVGGSVWNLELLRKVEPDPNPDNPNTQDDCPAYTPDIALFYAFSEAFADVFAEDNVAKANE